MPLWHCVFLNVWVNHANFPSTFSRHTPTSPSTSSPFILSSSPFLPSDDESDPEASELDLGTKIKTPKDLMLEELSLLKNKGSKMFRMRQQRVEKFIVTNENMVKVKRRKGACVCLRVLCVHACTDQTTSSFYVFQQNLQNLLMSPPPIPPKPEMPKEDGRIIDALFVFSVPFPYLRCFLYC